MATQGERQNFVWRPNTNDSTTLTRYDQEAQHWVRAFKGASIPRTTLGGFLGGFGIILDFILSILWLLFYSIGRAFTWLFGSKNGGKFKMNRTDNTPPMPSNDEFDAMFNDVKERNVYE